MASQPLGKYARLEVERRYLLREWPRSLVGRPADRRIIDRYFADTRLRLRQVQRVQTGEVTLKLGQKFRSSAQSASETTITNIVLNEAEYELLRSLGGNEIVKDRYLYELDALRCGVDVVRGELTGLILAEVECDTRSQVDAISCPDFAVAEVTEDVAFTGGELAKLTASDLRVLLDGRLR